MNDFAFIGFCVRTGTPRLHGATEDAAWRQLIDQRLNRTAMPLSPRLCNAYIDSMRHLLKIVFCGDDGTLIWQQNIRMAFKKNQMGEKLSEIHRALRSVN
jgi:hypothetical protein